ncbi:Ketosamine-3-kinase [Termitomyces sp. T112]|nr:Ketosamine-3-kinase [Termitomyces sp. T112]
MSKGGIPDVLFDQLKFLEQGADFTGIPPRVQSSSGKTYFVKYGSSVEQEQYKGEVESLKAMWEAAPGLSPRVLSSGVDSGNRPFFISEYKDLHRLGDATAKVLATRMATELHAKASEKGFGFHVPTYCGVTRLRNGDLVDQLRNKGCHEELCDLGNEVRERVVPQLLGSLKIQPVLLHGDLWSGNVGVDGSQRPIIFDPSSFYGHNEADLAISRIFGGFPPAFYSTYHDLRPKSDPVSQYPHRCDLYELFHYLNHTLIFGGGYEQSAKQKIRKLLDWAES